MESKRYAGHVIRSFGDSPTRALLEGKVPARWRPIRRQAERRLNGLDATSELRDLAALPSNRLEKLKGGRGGQYSIRINGQWRVCFEWREDGPHDVSIVDYH
jgi:proteic killer suppression protein